MKTDPLQAQVGVSNLCRKEKGVRVGCGTTSIGQQSRSAAVMMDYLRVQVPNNPVIQLRALLECGSIQNAMPHRVSHASRGKL
mmetsp:Transcript_33547/g.101365  ORF Transcript_33547/g.101365 Transcript_33547/m.101365 type:complete len:83 (+) Transcript_33547:3171-3419(+)